MVKTAFHILLSIINLLYSRHLYTQISISSLKHKYSTYYLLCKDLKFGKNVNITEILIALTWIIRTQTAFIVLLFSITIDILYLYE
jgi:hypothetical protein